MADLGIGVCKSAQELIGEVPSTIFISHNHSDHAGELPVVLAVEGSKHRVLERCASRGLQRKRKMQVVGEPEVLNRFGALLVSFK